MKIEYSSIPQSMAKMETYGFSWMDFITAIPSPLFVVTSFKSNGKPNACLQSWACFNGEPEKFYAILSCVNKTGHLYRTIKKIGEVVLNFPSADIYDLCTKTIENNGFDDDEITLSGLTAEPATMVNAPRIKECFLSLESRYAWDAINYCAIGIFLEIGLCPGAICTTSVYLTGSLIVLFYWLETEQPIFAALGME